MWPRKHAREIAELLENGQYSKLRNRTEARHKSFADLVEVSTKRGEVALCLGRGFTDRLDRAWQIGDDFTDGN